MEGSVNPPEGLTTSSAPPSSSPHPMVYLPILVLQSSKLNCKKACSTSKSLFSV